MSTPVVTVWDVFLVFLGILSVLSSGQYLFVASKYPLYFLKQCLVEISSSFHKLKTSLKQCLQTITVKTGNIPFKPFYSLHGLLNLTYLMYKNFEQFILLEGGSDLFNIQVKKGNNKTQIWMQSFSKKLIIFCAVSWSKLQSINSSSVACDTRATVLQPSWRTKHSIYVKRTVLIGRVTPFLWQLCVNPWGFRF